MPSKINLEGHIYGNLVVKKESEKKLYNRVTWVTVCQCGTQKLVTSNDLRTGKITSCGKYSCKEYNTKVAHEACKTHGKSNTRLYGIWSGMKKRCNSEHPNYGAIGVSYCEEWKDFINFYNWAIENGYKKGLTIDRINSYGDYSPSNCRWVNMLTQSRNRKTNRLIEYKGEMKCLTEWAEYFNINSRT